MFNKLHKCLGAIAVLTCLTATSLSSKREVGRPIYEVDVAAKSAPYRASIAMPVKNVQLAFVGEDRLAVMSQDDIAFPETGSLRKKFHLTLDVFSVKGGGVDTANQLRYETETADSRAAVLPSGRMIISINQELILLNEKLQAQAASSLNQACAPEAGLSENEGYAVALFPASEEVAVVSVQPIVARKSPPDRPGHWCWFSTRDLRPLGQTQFFLSLQATARDLLVYTQGPGSHSLSPAGAQTLSIPRSVSCNVNELDLKFPNFFLLHAEDAYAFRCRKGTVSISHSDEVREIPLRGADSWFFQTDAWNAPIAIFSHTGAYRPELGAHAMGTHIERIANYDSGVSSELPEPKPALYRGRYLAISPSGRRFATLTGPLLSVFETPPQILARPF